MDAYEFIIAVIAIVCLFVVLPAMTMARGRRRSHRAADDGASAEEVAEMRAIAERLERRMRVLEDILDEESPGWRRRMND